MSDKADQELDSFERQLGLLPVATPSQTFTTRFGLVSYFDVLGYRELLRRAKPEVIATAISTAITSAAKEVPETILRSPFFRKWLGTNPSALQTCVFSDTIILGIEVPRSPEANVMDVAVRVEFMLAICHLVQSRLFRAGLPVRGAVEIGEYILEDRIFAGESIVSAYDISCNLDLVACVLSHKVRMYVTHLAGRTLARNTTFADHLDLFCTLYPVPRKRGGQEQVVTIDYRPPIPRHAEDIRQVVLRAFWSYGREIGAKEQTKVTNTEQYLRFLQETDYLGEVTGNDKRPSGEKALGTFNSEMGLPKRGEPSGGGD